MTEEQKKEEAKKEETKAEAPKEEKKEVKLTKSMKGIVETHEKMTVLELSDLVKALEDKFGVSAQAAMAVPAMAAAGAPGAAGAAAEEKTVFTIVLADVGKNKIQVIKEIRAITTLGLKEAKELVEGAPTTVKEAISKEDAEKLVKALKDAGADAELK